MAGNQNKWKHQDHLMGYQKVQNCRYRKKVKDKKEKKMVGIYHHFCVFKLVLFKNTFSRIIININRKETD